MFKMMIVLLSLVFTVAACNKNNSKADRVKKNPALPGAPAADQKPLETNPADTEPAKTTPETEAGKRKGDKEDKGKDSPGTESPPSSDTTKPDQTEGEKPDPKVMIVGGSVQTPAPSETPAVAAKPGGSTAPTQPAEKVAETNVGVKITSYPTMGYKAAEMTTEKGKNSLITSALLNENNEQSRRARLNCYDPKTVEANKENIPELFIFPGSEVLVEIKEFETVADEVKVGRREDSSNITHLLTTCQGSKSDTQADKNYDYLKLKAEKYQKDYLRVDSLGKNKDREMAEVSIICSHETNISAKMDRQKDEKKNIINNRITLSRGSKIMFARPVDYLVIVDKSKKTKKLKEIKKLKDYSIIECE